MADDLAQIKADFALFASDGTGATLTVDEVKAIFTMETGEGAPFSEAEMALFSPAHFEQFGSAVAAARAARRRGTQVVSSQLDGTCRRGGYCTKNSSHVLGGTLR